MALTTPKFDQINSTVTKVIDPLFEINSALTGANTDDLGVLFNRGSTGNRVGIIWDRSAGEFAVIETTADSDSTGDMTITAYKNLSVNNLSTASFTLPTTDGTSGQAIITDGLGTLSWAYAGDPAYVSESLPTTLPTATGTDALAMGEAAVSSGANGISIYGSALETRTIAIGLSSQGGQTGGGTVEINAIAIGYQAKAYEQSTISIGAFSAAGVNGTTADPGAIAIGSDSLANKLNSTSIGTSSDANGDSSVALGSVARAIEDNCIAIGSASQAGQSSGGTVETGAISLGYNSRAYETSSIAIGDGAITGQSGTSTDPDSIAIGRVALADQEAAVSIGPDSDARGTSSVALGDGAQSLEDRNIAIGYTATAGQTNGGSTEIGAVAIGDAATAYETGGISIGDGAVTGVTSATADPDGIAIGRASSATGEKCIALGAGATSSYNGSFSLELGISSDGSDTTYKLAASTTDGTVTLMTGYNESGGIPVANNTMMFFSAHVFGVRTSTSSQQAAYKLEGIIKNSAGTTAIVGTVVKTIIHETDAAWDVSATANDTSDTLEIKVTGVAATNISWVSKVQTFEIVGV